MTKSLRLYATSAKEPDATVHPPSTNEEETDDDDQLNNACRTRRGRRARPPSPQPTGGLQRVERGTAQSPARSNLDVSRRPECQGRAVDRGGPELLRRR